MALSRVGVIPRLESSELAYCSPNLLTRLSNRPSPVWFCDGNNLVPSRRRKLSVSLRCSASASKDAVEVDPAGNSRSSTSELGEEDSGHVVRFRISDFRVLNHVSVGLGGRSDEIVFEATVKDASSPLFNSKVVLRRLTSVHAQRRGKRAIEVLKKLVRKRLMYHSYSVQVHGYISSATSSGRTSFTLVHGYHGSFSLRHWLQKSDWLPTLEATLALDEESVRKVGDDKIGGPEVSRQLRLIRILMRDLLIGVNYLHSHGLAHTELKLENVHISPVDGHIKVGILGNAADFNEDGSNGNSGDTNTKRRQMMIAFDMRCVGFMMAKMVLRELMEPSTFAKFKSFLTKGNDPSCLREFLLPMLSRNSPLGNVGLQILDRNWGAGWNLLYLLLAPMPSKRIRCLDALRHPFLCGPRWKIIPSMDIIRWGLGSTAVRISEEYIYGQPQRTRLAHFIELMEMLNPHPKPTNWLELLPGKWRMLYCTGRHIGLTLRQPSARVLIRNAHLTISKTPNSNSTLSFASEVDFKVMAGQKWPHDKAGSHGKMQANSSFSVKPGRQVYLKEEESSGNLSSARDSLAQKLSDKRWGKIVPFKELPASLPVAELASSEVEITLDLGDGLSKDMGVVKNVVREVRLQVPPEMFDLTKLVCGTYVDTRMLVLRGVNGSALLFTRSCESVNLR